MSTTQKIIDEVNGIVEKYNSKPEAQHELESQLRQLFLDIKAVDEKHEELYAAVQNAATALFIYSEPDTGLTLAHIEAEVHHSKQRLSTACV